MAIEHSIAMVYAQTLLDVSQRSGRTSAIVSQTPSLIDIYESPKLRAFLELPNVTRQEKKRLIQRVLTGHFDPLLINLAFILIDRNRPAVLPDILRVFLDLEERHRGIYPAEVITAIPLDGEMRIRLKKSLERYVGYRLKIEWQVDPRVIGGVVFRFQDYVLDDSLWGHLLELRSRLLQTSLP